MDIKSIAEKVMHIFKKYRYAVIVLIIGLILMAVPGTTQNTDSVETTTVNENIHEATLEEKLASILSQVDGAGKVQVILTAAAGEEIIYQTNNDLTSNDESNSTDVDTVTITDSERNQTGLIRQVNPPIYQGAIVVCQGADDPTVQLAIVDAVSKLTGLGANRISVLKMK